MNPRSALTIAAAIAAMGMPAVGGGVEVIHRRESGGPPPLKPERRKSHAGHWRGYTAPKRAAAKAKNRERTRKESQRRNRKQKR